MAGYIGLPGPYDLSTEVVKSPNSIRTFSESNDIKDDAKKTLCLIALMGTEMYHPCCHSINLHVTLIILHMSIAFLHFYIAAFRMLYVCKINNWLQSDIIPYWCY